MFVCGTSLDLLVVHERGSQCRKSELAVECTDSKTAFLRIHSSVMVCSAWGRLHHFLDAGEVRQTERGAAPDTVNDQAHVCVAGCCTCSEVAH